MKAFAVNKGCALVCLTVLGETLTLAQTMPPPPPVPPAVTASRTSGLITSNGGAVVLRPMKALPTPPALPTVNPVIVRAAGQTGAPPKLAGPMPSPVPALPPPVMPTTTTPPDALVFDAESKEYTAKPGEASATFTFNVTNRANVEVQVNNVHTSCGCTVAKLPEQPWKIAPGKGGPIGVTVDLRFKRGVLVKSVTVQSTSGVKNLLVKVNIPDEKTGFVDSSTGGTLDPDRVKNIQLSLGDRQAVFKKQDCAQCHADKAAGKMGKELYDLICAVCHDTPHRATMVTNLKERHPYTADIWRQWITSGKTNTLMPAFALTEGGPLTHEQINSLVDYGMNAFTPGAQPSLPPSGVSLAMPSVQPPRPIVMARPVPSPVVQPAVRPPPARPAVQVRAAPPPPPTAPALPEPPPVPIPDYTFPTDR